MGWIQDDLPFHKIKEENYDILHDRYYTSKDNFYAMEEPYIMYSKRNYQCGYISKVTLDSIIEQFSNANNDVDKEAE